MSYQNEHELCMLLMILQIYQVVHSTGILCIEMNQISFTALAEIAF